MPVLCIRSTNVSSCAFVAYVRFRLILNPEGLLHRHRGAICQSSSAETEIAPPDFVRLLGRLVNYVRMVQFGLSVRRRESTAKK